MTEYGEDYFERGIETGTSLYTNYRWIPELTIPLAATLCEQLGIKEGERVLDFGCAKGYLVKALRLLHRDAWGCDVSEYALDHSPEDVRGFLGGPVGWTCSEPFDWVLAKDVLEHLEPIAVPHEMDCLVGRRAWACVPLGDGNGKYDIPAMELDKTHRIREPLEWWIGQFERAGFTEVTGTYSMPHVKEHWAHYEKGHGFIMAR